MRRSEAGHGRRLSGGVLGGHSMEEGDALMSGPGPSARGGKGGARCGLVGDEAGPVLESKAAQEAGHTGR